MRFLGNGSDFVLKFFCCCCNFSIVVSRLQTLEVFIFVSHSLGRSVLVSGGFSFTFAALSAFEHALA